MRQNQAVAATVAESGQNAPTASVGLLDAIPADTNWNVAICQPRHDRLACVALVARGYTAYRPVMPRVYSNGRRELEDPHGQSLFPGYLFVIPSRHGWESLRTAPGMAFGDRALHKINGRLATIPHNDVAHIGILQVRQLEISLWTIRTNCTQTVSRFKPGDHVEIHKGPWVEFCGTVERLDGPERCNILIQMLGRQVRAYVNPAHLIHAEA